VLRRIASSFVGLEARQLREIQWAEKIG